MREFMKRFLILAILCLTSVGTAMAMANEVDDILFSNKITVISEGERINWPLNDGSIIGCYATMVDGSIDDFREYNDYFLVKNGHLYSGTMQKIYKAEKGNKLKKVDRANLLRDGKTLKLYDPLWEGSIRRHKRTVKINITNGNYYMNAFQDNAMWYRRAVTTGHCKVILNK